MSTVLLFYLAFGKEGGEAERLKVTARKLTKPWTDCRDRLDKEGSNK